MDSFNSIRVLFHIHIHTQARSGDSHYDVLVPPPGVEPGPRTSEARVLSIKLWELRIALILCVN
jgi:hypothetical protein